MRSTKAVIFWLVVFAVNLVFARTGTAQTHVQIEGANVRILSPGAAEKKAGSKLYEISKKTLHIYTYGEGWHWNAATDVSEFALTGDGKKFYIISQGKCHRYEWGVTWSWNIPRGEMDNLFNLQPTSKTAPGPDTRPDPIVVPWSAKDDCSIVFQKELGAQIAYVRNNGKRSVTVVVASTLIRRGESPNRLEDQVFNLSPGQQTRVGGADEFNGVTVIYSIAGADYR